MEVYQPTDTQKPNVYTQVCANSSVHTTGLIESIFHKRCICFTFIFFHLVSDTPSLKKEQELTELIVVAHVHIILALEEEKDKDGKTLKTPPSNTGLHTSLALPSQQWRRKHQNVSFQEQKVLV